MAGEPVDDGAECVCQRQLKDTESVPRDAVARRVGPAVTLNKIREMRREERLTKRLEQIHGRNEEIGMSGESSHDE